jgi:hypothetical protein
MRTLTTLLFALATASTAAAQPANARLPQNQQPQTEERYQPRNQLADVALDPSRTRAYIQVPRTGGQLDYLELRAGRTRINLIDVEVKFADGTSIHTGDRGIVEAYEGRVINLPRRASPVIAIVPNYRTVGNRVAARLQVFGVREHGRWQSRR